MPSKSNKSTMTSFRLIYALLLPLSMLCVLSFGYAWIADYGDDVAIGTYVLDANGQKTTLTLKLDHTFREVTRSGTLESAGQGTWRRIGEGGLAFSKGMLPLAGEMFTANGDTYGVLYKTLGIWPPFISLESSTGQLVFRKQLLGGHH